MSVRDSETYQLQGAINRRGRVPQIAQDGIYGPETKRAEIETGRIMGVSPYKGSASAKHRRRAVIFGQRRTPIELARAKRLRTTRADGAPKIVRLDVTVTNRFGGLGGWLGLVGHYTAGPRDTNDAHALSLFRQYHQQHAAQGWGGIGYHLGITTAGTLVLLRPTALKGTHVAGANTGRIGVVVHGTTGQRMTEAQRATWRWLKQHGHTSAMPASHRLPGAVPHVWVHNDLNATSCPGAFESDYKAA